MLVIPKTLSSHLLAVIIILLSGCSGFTAVPQGNNATPPIVIIKTGIPQVTITSAPEKISTLTPFPIPAQIPTIVLTNLPINNTSFNLELIAEGLFVPWSIVFTGNDRLLVSERNGSIREIIGKQLNPTPLISFSAVTVQQEAGLLGLALDPDYKNNQFLYACYTTTKKGAMVNRVVKLKDLGTSIVEVGIIIDDVPASYNHAGGRIHFGPDGKLYLTAGDALQKNLAQDLNSPAGKLLRYNLDGSIPADNPFKNSPIFTYGNRNSQGFDWNPANHLLYETEHGPTGFDGPPGGDEINLIQPGGNYGWPLVSHTQKKDGTISPLVEFTPAVAPGSGMFYRSSLFPQFTNSFFFGGLEGADIYRLVLSTTNPYEITLIDKLNLNVGRVRDVVEAPDGSIYFTTSNRDGRGTLRAGDDKIYRITPK
jgi:glucose/arabinose dehydrogenase